MKQSKLGEIYDFSKTFFFFSRLTSKQVNKKSQLPWFVTPMGLIWKTSESTRRKIIFTIAACCIWQTPGLLALFKVGVLNKVWFRPQVGNFLLFNPVRCISGDSRSGFFSDSATMFFFLTLLGVTRGNERSLFHPEIESVPTWEKNARRLGTGRSHGEERVTTTLCRLSFPPNRKLK